MLKISEMRSDVMGQFHNALYLGDVEERVKILESSGHYPLAYLTAKTHGLVEDADRIEAMLKESGVAVPSVDGTGKLLTPPAPILREDNWPLLTVTKGFFEGVLAGDVAANDYAAYADEDDGAGAGWGDDLDLDLGGEDKDQAEIDPLAAAGLAPEETGSDGEDDGSDAGWDMEDLELPRTWAARRTTWTTPCPRFSWRPRRASPPRVAGRKNRRCPASTPPPAISTRR